MSVHIEKFEITDDDLENEFNPNRWRPRLSKNQQIYGIWADPEDSDEEPRRPSFAKKSYTTPVSFVEGGIQQAGKKPAPTEKESQPNKSSESDSSSEEEVIPVKYPSRFGRQKQQTFARFGTEKEEFGGWEEHTKGIGQKLLLQMGYQPGRGLGRDLQGITNPIEAKLRKGRGAIGLYGSEKTSTAQRTQAEFKQAEEKSVKQWKKKTEDTKNKKKVKYVYKTPEEVIAESTSRRLPGDMSQMSKVKVLDLTGPQPQVLPGYHAIHQQHSKPSEVDDDNKAAKQFRTFSLPELTHNLDLLLDMTEQEIILNDREQKHENDMVINIQHEEEKLSDLIDHERKEIRTMERILDIVESLEERSTEGCKNPLTLAECASIFRKFQEDFYEEYKLHELVNMAVSVVHPILKAYLADWDPLKDQKFALDVFQEWKDILDTNSTNFDTSQMDPYQRLFWETWLPPVRQAISNWNCRDCVPLIELLENWLPLIPPWCLNNILDQLVFPKLQQEVEDWNPLQDRMYIHVWLHPWLPLMGARLEPLYGPIRQKLGHAMVNWHPCDDSARKILQPWKGVFPAGAMEMFVSKNIMPKLSLCLQEFVINPHQQHLEPWHWVMAWEDFLPLQGFVLLLDRNFFPKWLNVLCIWLGRNPNYDEVTKWYLGWKSMFSERLHAHPTIKERFNQALDIMNRSASVKYQPATNDLIDYAASLERQREMNAAQAVSRNFEAISQGIRNVGSSAANVTLTFKDLIERKAQELGLIFMPVPNRYYEAKQVHRFGRVLLYIDRGVIFVQNGETWIPTSLQALVDIAQ